jgi:hypothetical protein
MADTTQLRTVHPVMNASQHMFHDTEMQKFTAATQAQFDGM